MALKFSGKSLVDTLIQQQFHFPPPMR
jgi:hypothetical protein